MTKYLIAACVTLLSFHTGWAQKNMSLVGYLPMSDDLSDVWGYVDDMGREYAIVGLKNGTAIVDLNNPANPVQIHFVPGPSSTWRDMKVWNKHAYITNETSDGLLIIDLSQLPGSIATNEVRFTNSTAGYDTLSTAHNIFIDENGFAYLFGYNNSNESIPTDNRGALILSLNSNPKQPVQIGRYTAAYVHDGYVRNDTMWTSEIYEGNFAAVNVSNKGNPVLLGFQSTPNRFTHNCWLSDDGNTLYTTDERTGAYVASFDVSNLDNIRELDRYQSSPGAGVIPHNTFVKGNYLVTSYYKDGVTLVDATKPGNLVEVGNFDTSPFTSEDGFSGCWGVYPYLPSGLIIASDIEEGLFVLQPTYTRACYLEGKVTSNLTPSGLNAARVEFIGSDEFKFATSNGNYKTGTPDPGTYAVRFFKYGCETKIVNNVSMQAGQTTTLNVEMNCTSVGIDDPDAPMLQLAASQTVFQNEVTFKLNNNTGFQQSSFRVYNLQGVLMESYDIDTPLGEITTGKSWANGIYIAELTSENQRQTLKMVKGQ